MISWSSFFLIQKKVILFPMKKLLLFYLLSISFHCHSQTAEKYYNEGIKKLYLLADKIGAIQDFNKAIELSPDSSKYYGARGEAKTRLDDYRGGISDFDKAMTVEPTKSYHYQRGLAKAKLENYQGAIDDFTKSIEAFPTSILAYIERALIRLRLGDKEGGCLDLSKAGELGYMHAYDLIQTSCN
jgi:tetratricopeptide (TPR) repeat protein